MTFNILNSNYSTRIQNIKNAYIFLSKNNITKGVIVFDIDDTLIDSKTLSPIKEVVQFYNWTKGIGLTPVIVTARIGYSHVIDWTINNLSSIGITDYTHIYFRPEYMINLVEFKKECRKDINSNIGYVVMSVGDKYWDIGEYGGYGVLV